MPRLRTETFSYRAGPANPINGAAVEGSSLESELPLVRGNASDSSSYGKTIGELAIQFRDESFPKCALTICQ